MLRGFCITYAGKKYNLEPVSVQEMWFDFFMSFITIIITQMIRYGLAVKNFLTVPTDLILMRLYFI